MRGQNRPWVLGTLVYEGIKMAKIRLKKSFFFTSFRFSATQVNVKNIYIFYLPLFNSVA
jgi:hypothetical protein